VEFHRIALRRLALDDRTFDLAFARRYEALRRSIAEVGILQPLVIRQRPTDDSRQIVCGFGRATVADSLQIAEVLALLLNPATTDGDCLRLAFFDNLSHRQFNPIERAIVLMKLGQHVGREQLVADYLPLLGMQPSSALLDRTLVLMALTDSLKLSVAERRIEEKVGIALASLPPDDQEAISSLLERCRPSVSVAREWTEALLDVARRDQRTLREILAMPDVVKVLDSPQFAAAERTASLRRVFHRLRYPTVSACEERFARAKADLGLPPSMRLEPTPSFESDEMRLEVRFRNPGDLRRAAAVFQKWFDNPNLLKRLWPDRIAER